MLWVAWPMVSFQDVLTGGESYTKTEGLTLCRAPVVGIKFPAQTCSRIC